MTKVLPVINCIDKEETEQRIRKIKRFLPHGGWVHLDVADGRFTFHKTWEDYHLIKMLAESYRLEVHLMILEPERFIEYWLKKGARRVVVHYEAIFDKRLRSHKHDPLRILKELKAACEDREAELVLALNPETKLENLYHMIHLVDNFLILSVHPGLAGQHFLILSLEKIKLLHDIYPDAKIEVDGGINPQILGILKKIGVNSVTSEHYIFSHKEPGKAFKELESVR